MSARLATAAVLALLTAACSRSPIITTEPDLKAGGTIAGIVRATDGSAALSARKVTVIHGDLDSGRDFEITVKPRQ